MNIGSSVYTEFDYNSEVVNAYDVFEAGIEQSTGLVHSHHNMSTFFSNVDQTELKDNAKNYNYYVSLIVNFAHEYCAKIAFPSKTTVVSESWVKDNNGKLFKKKFTKEENTILIGDLKVIIEDDTIAPEWLNDRIEALEVKKKAAATPPICSGRNFQEFNNSRNFQDDFDWKPDFTPNRVDPWLPKTKSNVSKAQQFLAALIYQDGSKSSMSINNGFNILSELKPDELEEFEASLDINLEILHEQVYGANSDRSLTKHCLEALLELQEYELNYGGLPAFEIINQSIGLYAV